jgi:hypothetical protein
LKIVTGGLNVIGGGIITGGLTVSGTILGTGVSTFTSSDRRLKTNIIPIHHALKKVSQVNGVYYNWIQNEETGRMLDKKRHVGIIAQDLERVLPEVVHTDGKYLTVDYQSIIALIIEAIHELDNLIQNQKELSSVNSLQTLFSSSLWNSLDHNIDLEKEILKSIEMKKLINSLNNSMKTIEVDILSLEKRIDSLEDIPLSSDQQPQQQQQQQEEEKKEENVRQEIPTTPMIRPFRPMYNRRNVPMK